MLAALSLTLLSGCGNKDVVSTQGAASSSEKQIQTIQSNPQMPPDAKAAATQRIQQQQAAGAYMRQQAAKGK